MLFIRDSYQHTHAHTRSMVEKLRFSRTPRTVKTMMMVCKFTATLSLSRSPVSLSLSLARSAAAALDIFRYWAVPGPTSNLRNGILCHVQTHNLYKIYTFMYACNEWRLFVRLSLMFGPIDEWGAATIASHHHHHC